MTTEPQTQPGAQTPPLMVTNLQQFVETIQEKFRLDLTVAFDNNGRPTVAFSIPDRAPDELLKKLRELEAFILEVLEQAHEHRADYEMDEEDRHEKWNISYA